MGSRLARRVVQFANLPIKLLLPTSFTNIQEIALKTIPSATKIEIKRVLESLYGFEVERVQTLNMEGKKKKRGGLLFAKPDYKKAYVTLKTPLSIDMNLFPLKMVEDARKRMNKKNVSSVVEDEEEEERKRHWLEGDRAGSSEAAPRGYRGHTLFWDRGMARRVRGSSRRHRDEDRDGAAKFPWSNMRDGRAAR
ncbi:hypothetical protein HN51_046841 [Arachis hypogaea]|uniref:Large ribosomal subunit protein uL23m n=1 Tax=Arachis hypogaea TaxID=3818 RepID=A0A445AE84_ARAHY|nr:uncharacterized protein LOC107624934 [Arachis ipaensis]XP_020971158.1 uncharacterized protein LOC107624934 [Arachis ipaensis]XP_020971159.1 uncharacterized protein LOC107624934 [Arachis ipaensis]XP_025632257.1 uncharacterized protein LOC112726912 [Arachis hypogaea]XP_025632258.1 uncharacterized protein LOC112726912 [Arachis hypogaea]XP_025632259.1 uncharacterized protein LOC112726912 [Arachis hypogaea]XP_057740200.1 uncharacterized protein LOC130957346 isoform X2 [Arachis stenosperma]QHO2